MDGSILCNCVLSRGHFRYYIIYKNIFKKYFLKNEKEIIFLRILSKNNTIGVWGGRHRYHAFEYGNATGRSPVRSNSWQHRYLHARLLIACSVSKVTCMTTRFFIHPTGTRLTLFSWPGIYYTHCSNITDTYLIISRWRLQIELDIALHI